MFCITFQWEAPKKFLKTTKQDTFFRYLAKFKIESQMCRLEITFRFRGVNKKIQCDIDFLRETDFDEEEIDEDCRYDFQPIVVSIVMNQDKKRRDLSYLIGFDSWNFNDYHGSIACPAEIRFTDITWETTNPNEWKPLSCLLWLEFETFATRKKNALKQITALYVQQNQCDVHFNFQDDQHIGGHSHILVARSPVFAAMFQHEMKETKTGQVSIQDIQPGIFKQMLHFIYSVQLSVPLTETTAQRLFEAADKYDIGDLKDECVDFLLDRIRVNNVINLMAWAHIHSVKELKEATLTFTSLHGKEISKQRDWENLTKNYPEVCPEATRRIIDRMVLSSESNVTANSNRK
ncbi:BTB/POZ and MATH domain-containing protein 1-like isoform X2 [Daphnia pulex]|nr:BTB/POZ and MATH domain-containing protein 1-like isoform X2 [Daphnia pulex]